MITPPQDTEPLPCPFCGGIPIIEPKREDLPNANWWVVCIRGNSCAALPEVGGDTRAEAIARWNQRKGAKK